MPLFTSLLLFFIALALISFTLRNTSARQARQRKDQNERRMAIGAQICEASARDAFGVELDHSVESIVLLDSVIIRGWGDTPDIPDKRMTDSGTLDFIFSAYLGDVFVRNEKAVWQWQNNEAFLYFQNLRRTAMPFELIKRKLSDPNQVNLANETALWLNSLTPNDGDGISRS